MIVLDCSIALAQVLPEESSDFADAVIEYLETENIAPIVPSRFMVEYANGLIVAKRRKRIQAHEFKELLEAWLHTPIKIEADGDLCDIIALAERHRLTVYDACYLDLAIRLKMPLATVDKALAKAAKKEKVGFTARRA